VSVSCPLPPSEVVLPLARSEAEAVLLSPPTKWEGYGEGGSHQLRGDVEPTLDHCNETLCMPSNAVPRIAIGHRDFTER